MKSSIGLHQAVWHYVITTRSLGTCTPYPSLADEYIHRMRRWYPWELPTHSGQSWLIREIPEIVFSCKMRRQLRYSYTFQTGNCSKYNCIWQCHTICWVQQSDPAFILLFDIIALIILFLYYAGTCLLMKYTLEQYPYMCRRVPTNSVTMCHVRSFHMRRLSARSSLCSLLFYC